jgi:hypothetical protein
MGKTDAASCGEQAAPKRKKFLTMLVEDNPDKSRFWCVAKT